MNYKPCFYSLLFVYTWDTLPLLRCQHPDSDIYRNKPNRVSAACYNIALHFYMHCFVLMHCLPIAIDMILYIWWIIALEYPQYATTRWSPPVIRCLIWYNAYHNFWDYVAQTHLSHRCYTPYSVSILPNTILYFPSSIWTFYYERIASHREVSPFCIVTSPSRHPPPSSAN